MCNTLVVLCFTVGHIACAAQVKLRASLNKNMLNGGEQHMQLPKKGLSAQQISSSLEKRVRALLLFSEQAWQAENQLATVGILAVNLASNFGFHTVAR